MLVLTRWPGQSIIIDGDIVVTVVELRDGRVRLGVDAPQEVSVHREEIQRRIDKEKRNGTTGSGD